MKALQTISGIFFCAAAILLAATGCYTDRSPAAVENARSYVLENQRDLTELQRDYIRYTDPEIYENVIFPAYTFKLADFDHLAADAPSSLPRSTALDYMHSCVVWAPPGLGGKIVVVGQGERSMRFWTPNRILIKNYIPKNLALEQATATATEHMQNKMLFLSENERNRIRFSEPEVRLTGFDLPKEEPADEVKKDNWEEYMKELHQETHETQISLIWKADDPANRIVFCGYARDPKLTGWTIRTARYVPAVQLDAGTRRAPETPKQNSTTPNRKD